MKLFNGLALFTLLTMSSCSSSYLTVHTDYLSHKNLASYYVGTPDPRLNCPAIGERLIIYWSVPKEFLCSEDLHLEVTIRFRNREEIVEVFNIEKTRGTYVFSLINNDYFNRGGILTYKIDLIGGGCVYEEWRHQIWVDLIEINNQQDSCASEEPTEDFHIDWE